ncbi:MAG: DUF2993 domain-containing protein [Corynebacterium humireducens]|mgnify:FL=1|jgi:hypothetical protein|uniref:DUF2993 domain-containing protein n=1 Tax=Corynebacterium humireducens TaxID=1223514 RepID=A0A7X6PQQ1_9CORY|nr:DUF2993 domain-containing protein [Corynebacterium humireducens]
MASARSASSAIWKFIVGILVAVLVILLVAEFGLRWYIGNELRSGFQEQAARDGVTLEEDPTIAFGANPLVLSVVRGTIPHVEISVPSTLQVTDQAVLGQPAAVATLTDLDISDPGNPVAAHLVTTAEVPDSYMLATIQHSMRDNDADGFIQVTDLRSNPAEGTLDVTFNNGIAVLNLVPSPVDGALTFEAVGASLFGFNLPRQVSDVITQGLQQGVQEQAGDFRIEDFEVVEGGANLTLTGTDVELSRVADTQLPRS